jgi:hypothetical protein
MKPSNFVILFALIIFLFVFSSGCTTPGSNSQQTSSTIGSEAKVSFDQAYQNLKTDGIISKSPPVHIFYVEGSDLDSTGAAKEWRFGIRQGNSSYFYSYNATGGSKSSWPWDFPYQEITIGSSYLYPKDLLNQHKLFIQDITSTNSGKIDELELMDGIYQLTIQNGTASMTFYYDGKSGKELT